EIEQELAKVERTAFDVTSCNVSVKLAVLVSRAHARVVQHRRTWEQRCERVDTPVDPQVIARLGVWPARAFTPPRAVCAGAVPGTGYRGRHRKDDEWFQGI